VAQSFTTKRSGKQRKMELRLLKPSAVRELFLALKWISVQRTWPLIPERKSPKAWTGCAIGWLNILKWARVLPSGAQ
jgi:hypothetical protein